VEIPNRIKLTRHIGIAEKKSFFMRSPP